MHSYGETPVNPMQDRDTIAAIATPPGRGGIGIVRISGPEARPLATSLLGVAAPLLEPGRARFAVLHEPSTGARLDEAVVTYFAAPRSYTGEDVIEISAHGSPVLLAHLLQVLLAQGARLAEPGEFTERAFLSGRMDLTQAEAVRDLIDAKTLLQAQVAAQQMGGSLSRVVSPVKAELVKLIALLEAGIDFAEDDTPVLDDAALSSRLAALHGLLSTLESSFRRGRLVNEGISLAIVGRPNTGKSSLFNRLLERERAIVTAEPGTTRDLIEERLSLGGIPLQLTDTAGLREGASEAERMGIERSREALADAGLVLLVLDATEPLNEEERALLQAAQSRPLVIALNKQDLLDQLPQQDGVSERNIGSISENASYVTHPAPYPASSSSLPAADSTYLKRPSAAMELMQLEVTAPFIETSARTGQGIAALRATLERAVAGEERITAEDALLTNLRQHTSVTTALAAVEASQAAAANLVPHEMLLLDLYAALRALDALTGATTSDDVLHLIFSTFCIGK